MLIRTTALPGVLIIEPALFQDTRGVFLESYHQQRYQQAGLPTHFVQDNLARSVQGSLRGLHFQRQHPQGKLVSVVRGRVLDVVVDINPASPQFKQHVAVELDDHARHQLWVPGGYAHGYYVLSDWADYHYKCTDYYRPADEGGIAWNCPDLQLPWPCQTPRLSDKDSRHPRLQELIHSGRLPCAY